MKKKLTIMCQNKTLQCVFPIIEYDGEPILMVMQDDFDHLFLSLCSDFRAIHRWIVAPTNVEILHRLLDFDITINDALRAASRTAYIIERHGREYNFRRVLFQDIDPSFLAEEGVYADFIEEDCDDNLEQLDHELNANVQKYFVSSYGGVLVDNRNVFYPESNDFRVFRKQVPVQDYSFAGKIQSFHSIYSSEQSETIPTDDPKGFAA